MPRAAKASNPKIEVGQAVNKRYGLGKTKAKPVKTTTAPAPAVKDEVLALKMADVAAIAEAVAKRLTFDFDQPDEATAVDHDKAAAEKAAHDLKLKEAEDLLKAEGILVKHRPEHGTVEAVMLIGEGTNVSHQIEKWDKGAELARQRLRDILAHSQERIRQAIAAEMNYLRVHASTEINSVNVNFELQDKFGNTLASGARPVGTRQPGDILRPVVSIKVETR